MQRANGTLYEFEAAKMPGTLANGTRAIGIKTRTDPELCLPRAYFAARQARHTGQGLHGEPPRGEACIRNIVVRDV